MKINLKNFYEMNESKAFSEVLRKLIEECQKKFDDNIGVKDGWLDDSDDGLHDYFIKQLKTHSYKIDTGQGGYDEDDLIDIVNYVAMLYNLGEKIK